MESKIKVLFICKQRNHSYGISFGLLNSCTLVCKYLEQYCIECKVVQVIDANDIDREVSKYKPTHVVLEALWVTPEKLLQLLRLHKKVQWTVRIHSKTPFLAHEGIALKWMVEYAALEQTYSNFVVSFNDLETSYNYVDVIGLQGWYLPNLYPVKKKHIHRENHIGIVINIGCFGAIRPLKNQLQEAVAAIIFANKIQKALHFHINVNRLEQSGAPILKNIQHLFKAQSGHKLVEHNWCEHDKFIELIKKMDIGMQVSFSESFNIVTADFVANNIPAIGSHDITWLHNSYQVGCNSANEIAKKLLFAYHGIDSGKQIRNLKCLVKHNEQGFEFWEGYLFGA